MAFLDEFDKKLTMLGQGAIQKTKEVTDSAKITSAIKGLEMQKKDALSELGNMYYGIYKQYGGTVGKEAEEIIRRIKAIEDQTSQYKDQLQKIKGVIYCSSCGAEIPANSLFCNVCGAKIEQQSSEAPNNMEIPSSQNIPNYNAAPPRPAVQKTCKNCGTALEADQLFCVNCGTRVEDTTVIVPEPVEPRIEAELVNQDKNGRCPNCGAETTSDQEFCIMCGTALAGEKVSYDLKESGADTCWQQENPENQAVHELEGKICPNCGKAASDEKRFCTACGTKLG